MSAITPTVTPRGLLQHSAWDALLVLLALAQGGLLFAVMVGSVLSNPIVAIPLIAIGLWWNSNTISHNFIHNPFFRSPKINSLFAIYLSVLLGFPHALWRSRHLAHHSGAINRKQHPAELIVQSTLVLSMWIAFAMLMPAILTFVYLPAWLLGLTLCAMQGHFEHSRGTTSCYGMIYNWLFFKDGFHVEHHNRPRDTGHDSRRRAPRLRPVAGLRSCAGLTLFP